MLLHILGLGMREPRDRWPGALLSRRGSAWGGSTATQHLQYLHQCQVPCDETGAGWLGMRTPIVEMEPRRVAG